MIGLRPEPSPAGYGNWSLRMLGRRVVKPGIVDSISHETMRQTLKSTASRGTRCSTG